jgi:AcrR family transcriptional regulator
VELGTRSPDLVGATGGDDDREWSGTAATVSANVRGRPSQMRTVGSTREETGRRVHEAALRLFAQKGFAATGIREIAEGAGVSSGALYHYMGTKHDLLLEIMRSTIEPLIEAGQEILSGEDEPEVKLAALVELHVWFHGSHPLATTITDTEMRVLSSAQREDVMRRRDAYDDIWTSVVREGTDAGRYEVLDERVATLAILELCTGVSEWYAPGGRLELDELCSIHADMALGLLRARRGRRAVRRADLELPKPSELFADVGAIESGLP